jgi:hypothetical protein
MMLLVVCSVMCTVAHLAISKADKAPSSLQLGIVKLLTLLPDP